MKVMTIEIVMIIGKMHASECRQLVVVPQLATVHYVID